MSKSEAAAITFMGGPEVGDVGSTTWGNDATGRIVFPIRTPVVVDPAAAKSVTEADFLRHVIMKAKGNRFFVVEDAEGGGQAAEVKQPEPKPRTTPNRRRKGKADAADRADEAEAA